MSSIFGPEDDGMSDDAKCDYSFCFHEYAQHCARCGRCEVVGCECRRFEPPYPDDTSNQPRNREEAEQP